MHVRDTTWQYPQNNHTAKAYMTFRLYAWQWLKGTPRVRFVPLFKGPKREELKGF